MSFGSFSLAFKKEAAQTLYRNSNFGSHADGDTIKMWGDAAKANANMFYVEGADPGVGTHGYINGRKQAIINEGVPVFEGMKLNLFG